MLIPGYPEGSDITIMNTIYCKAKKNNKTNKYDNDYITIVYKDNKTNKKNHIVIENPEYTFYQAEPEYVKPYSELFIERDKCKPHTVKYTQIKKEIAKLTNNEDFFNYNKSSGMYRENEKLFKEPSIFGADTDIEDYYRSVFDREYVNAPTTKISKGYIDIEVDIKNQSGDFVKPGECPINCVSYIDEINNKVYIFILRYSVEENPLVSQFESSINSELMKELQEFVIDTVGGEEKAKKYKVDNLEFEFRFYDEEISLIADIWNVIRITSPDFLLLWNASFDIPYFIERIKVLGYDPNNIICDKSFFPRVCEYFIDEKHKNDNAERSDKAYISIEPTILDQMIQFASRRKSQIGSFPNIKLDTIGGIVAGVKKLNYSHITNDIAKLPYLDMKTFTFYNIIDVIVQKCIEISTKDINYIFTKCIMNDTTYSKGHRQTIYLINRIKKSFYEKGYITGNNVNRWNEKQKFQGALVGDPMKTSNLNKVYIGDRPTLLADNLLDQDYKSLYPSIDIEHNVAPNTLIGYIDMPDKVYNHENTYMNELYSRSGEFIENMTCDNNIEFCSRYFNLAGIEDLISDVNEYVDKYYYKNILNNNNNSLFYISSENNKYNKYNLFEVKDKDDNKYNLFEMRNKTDIDYNYYIEKIIKNN